MLERISRVSLPALLLLLSACGDGSQAVIAADYQQLPADRVLYGATWATTANGIRQAVTKADSMYVDEDSTTARLYGVKLMMYDTIGRTTADLTSVRGQLNQRTQKLTAQGNVVLALADGRHIETEELNYDPETHQIWSDVATVVRHPDGGTTRFDNFRADDKFQSLQGTNARGRIPGLKL